MATDYKVLIETLKPTQRVFIETGTCFGNHFQDVIEQGVFSKYFTVELADNLYETSKTRICGMNGISLLSSSSDTNVLAYKGKEVTMFRGDSSVVIPKLCEEIKEPALFFLDAHFCGGNWKTMTADGHFPLWAELIAIAKRPYDDIVVVDDVHTFGKDRSKDLKTPWIDVTTKTIVTAYPAKKSEIIKDAFVLWK